MPQALCDLVRSSRSSCKWLMARGSASPLRFKSLSYERFGRWPRAGPPGCECWTHLTDLWIYQNICFKNCINDVVRLPSVTVGEVDTAMKYCHYRQWQHWAPDSVHCLYCQVSSLIPSPSKSTLSMFLWNCTEILQVDLMLWQLIVDVNFTHC